MKYIIFTLFTLATFTAQAQNKFISRNGEISFFSKNKLEDIDAKMREAISILDTTTGSISCKVLIKMFMFKDKLMQDHFNENYLESDKFPYAILETKILEPIPYYKDGTYSVTLEGSMDMHGVKRKIKIPGSIEVKGGTIIGRTEFFVKLKDYDIAIPKIVIKNIAEEIKVTVNILYVPYVKKTK